MYKFCIIYTNDKELRRQILEQLLPIAAKRNLAQQPIQHPVFRTFPDWPNPEELESIPLNVQCEYLEYTGKTFVQIRVLVIDIEPANFIRSVVKYNRI